MRKTFEEDMILLKNKYPNADVELLSRLAITTHERDVLDNKNEKYIAIAFCVAGLAFLAGIGLGGFITHTAMVQFITQHAPMAVPELAKAGWLF